MTTAVKPSAKEKRIAKALRGPQPVPPIPEATEMLQEAARLVYAVWRQFEAAGRLEDAYQLSTTLNDLNYRHIPRSVQTACSDCIGYRQPMKVGVECKHA